MGRGEGDGSGEPAGRHGLAWPTLGLRDVPSVVRPLLIGSALQTLATAGFSTYVGVWAIEELEAPGAWLGLALALRAGSGVVTGYLGGALSDRVDRRRVVIASWLAQTVCIAAFVLVGRSVWWGLVLIVVFGPLGPPGRAAAAAYVADISSGEQRLQVYASQRSLQALGQILGPSLGALLVLDSDWGRMFVGFAVVSGVAVLLAVTMSSRHRHGGMDQRAEDHVTAAVPMRADTTFLVLLLVITLLTLVMAATDRFLPIAAVDEYGVDPAVWGLIAALNPVLVVGLQSVVTRRSARWSPVGLLWVSTVLLALPFLLLLRFDGVATVVAVVVLATLGEMLWMPLSQALGAELAPAARRGAYLGAYDGARSLAYALGPLVALSLADGVGYPPVWVFFAAVGLLAGAAGAGPVRRSGRQLRDDAVAT